MFKFFFFFFSFFLFFFKIRYPNKLSDWVEQWIILKPYQSWLKPHSKTLKNFSQCQEKPVFPVPVLVGTPIIRLGRAMNHIKALSVEAQSTFKNFFSVSRKTSLTFSFLVFFWAYKVREQVSLFFFQPKILPQIVIGINWVLFHIKALSIPIRTT